MKIEKDLHTTVALLQKKFASQLPGEEAQELMAPSFRNDYKADKNLMRESGVLLLLYPKNEMTHFVLMKRSAKLRTHRGQISLPGGKKDLTDTSFYQTAIRETYEEIGIRESQIELLGSLTPLLIPVSSFMVYPFVAYAKEELTFIPNKTEVERVLEVPITKLLDENTITEDVWEKKGRQYKKPFFDVGGQKVWGATAMILSEFRQLVLRD